MSKQPSPPRVLHPELYKQARKKADQVYKKHSAYKSMYIGKVYVALGGKYATKGSSLKRWNDEKWIQVLPYLKNKTMIACGADNDEKKVCRPFYRVTKNTPVTLPELLKIHTKSQLIDLAKKKRANMKGRVFWKTLKYYSSKPKSNSRSSKSSVHKLK